MPFIFHVKAENLGFTALCQNVDLTWFISSKHAFGW